VGGVPFFGIRTGIRIIGRGEDAEEKKFGENALGSLVNLVNK
jgi:hypothetical protein